MLGIYGSYSGFIREIVNYWMLYIEGCIYMFYWVTRFIHKSGKELVTLVDILVLLEILLLFTYA